MLALIGTSTGLNLVSSRMVETQKQIVSGDLTASLSDYGKAFHDLTEAESKTTAATQQLEAVQRLYRFAVEDSNKILSVYNETGETTRTTTKAMENDFSGFKGEVQRLSGEVSTNVKAQQIFHEKVDKVIGSLVIYARATGESTSAMRDHAAEAGLDAAAIDRLAFALDGAAQAQLRFQAQRASFKLPDFDFAGTSIGQIDSQKNFADALKGSSAALDEWYRKAGLANDAGRKQRDLYIAMTPLAKAQNDELTRSIERLGTENGQHLNKKEVLARVRQELTAMAGSMNLAAREEGQMRLRVLESNEALRESGKQHNGAAAAARSYANALVDLRARAADIEAELSLDAFALMEFRIRTQIQKEREHLEINKRDKEAALLILDRIERAMIEKAHLDALRANDGFNKQQFEQHRKHLEQVEKQEAQHQQKLLQMFIDRKKAEEGDKRARARLALASQDVANEARRAEIAERAALEIEKVARAYSHASKEERIFGLQLRALEQFTKGDFFGGLITSIQAWNAELIQSGGYAQIWSDAIVGAFDQTLNSGASFLDAFGKLLIAGLLKAYGQAAIASGTYHITEGIARMATLWDFAGGAREFAAGTALVALGAAMTGAAGAIQNSIGHKPAAGGASAAGSAGSTASTGASGSRREPQIVKVAFPTSGTPAQSIIFAPVLDGPATKGFWGRMYDSHLESKQVLSIDTIRGKHRRRVKEALDIDR
jgi:hypothetical protein